MPNKYRVKLSDGRSFDVETEGGPPSEQDVMRTVGAGNVNLFAQPKVKNPDGTTSTVDSRSFNFDGQEVLLPSVTPDGRHLKTDEDVVAEYKKTGRYLGKFKTVNEANAYGKQLHEDYAAGKYDAVGAQPTVAWEPGQDQPWSRPAHSQNEADTLIDQVVALGRSSAHPVGVGDVLPLLIMSGAPNLPVKDFLTRSVTALKKAGLETHGLADVLKFPARAIGKFADDLPSAVGARIAESEAGRLAKAGVDRYLPSESGYQPAPAASAPPSAAAAAPPLSAPPAVVVEPPLSAFEETMRAQSPGRVPAGRIANEAALAARRAAAAAPKLRLSAEEVTLAMSMAKAGKTPAAIQESIRALRALASKPGVMSTPAVSAEIAARVGNRSPLR